MGIATMTKLGVVWGASRPPGVRAKTFPPGMEPPAQPVREPAADGGAAQQPGRRGR